MKNKSLFYRNTIVLTYCLVVIILSWISITCFIQRFKCPQMTETQIILHIPHSFVCD